MQSGPSLQRAVQLIASVIAPTTAVTAMLFYFGWSSTAAEARRLGLNETILGYSTRDYILRSIWAMFTPLIVGLVLLLGCLWGHGTISRQLAVGVQGSRRRKLRLASWAAITVGLVTIAIALYDQLVAATRINLLAPLCFAIGIGVIMYATHLLSGPLSSTPTTTQGDARWRHSAQVTIIGLLLALNIFWAVSDYADHVGTQLGDRILYGQAQLPNAVLFSPRRLYIQFDGIIETRLGDTDGSYRYRYEGLLFLERSGGHYFLRPASAKPSQPSIIVLPESDAPQLQFVR